MRRSEVFEPANRGIVRAAVFHEKCQKAFHLTVVDRIADMAAFPVRGQKSGPFERSQVKGHARRLNIELFGNRAGREPVSPLAYQQSESGEPVFLRKRSKRRYGF